MFKISSMWQVCLSREDCERLKIEDSEHLKNLLVNRLNCILIFCSMQDLVKYCDKLYKENLPYIQNRAKIRKNMTRLDRVLEPTGTRQLGFNVHSDSKYLDSLYQFGRQLLDLNENITSGKILKLLIWCILESDISKLQDRELKTTKAIQKWLDNQILSVQERGLIFAEVIIKSKSNKLKTLFRAYEDDKDSKLLSYTDTYDKAKKFNTTKIKSLNTLHYLPLEYYYEADDPLKEESEYIVWELGR